MAVSIGKPWPLGSSLVDGGVNFSVAAPEATKVELLLFASGSANEPNQIIELTPLHRSAFHDTTEKKSPKNARGARRKKSFLLDAHASVIFKLISW